MKPPWMNTDGHGCGSRTQVTVAHAINKKFPDIIVGNKKGLFLFPHEVKHVNKQEWEKAQPKLVQPTNPAGKD